ncbi:integrase, catalytic region, zinc finger, CCHC-type containing protein [Tanacetum coccineum]
MSTSTTHQQSLADAGSETRPLTIERDSYIPWASRFRRYLDRKRENQKWLNKAINEGDDLKHYEAEIEAMILILISILNDIYNSVDACTTAQAMWQRLMNDLEKNGIKFPKVTVNTKFLNCLQPEWLKYVTQVRLTKRLIEDSYDDLFDYLSQYEKLFNISSVKKLEKSHDPLALVAHTGSSSRIQSPYYVTHPSLVIDYDDDYQGDAFQNISKDPLTSAMMLLARAITQCFFNPTNNRLQNSSNYVFRICYTANVQCYNCSEKGHYARNCLKPKVRDSKYFMEHMLPAKQDEAGVTLTDEHNDYLVADATRMEKIKELSANICLMARIQQANIDSDARPSYDSAFLSEVQQPSTSYVNPLFAKDNQEQKYLKQPKIINNTIGDDQIDSNIIFDKPNVDVNSGIVEYDNNVQTSYELEQLAKNAYKEAEKQQINSNKADNKSRRLEKDLQTQFIRDQDIIRDLEQKRDNLQLSVVDLKSQIVELQKMQTILKQKMSENEDKYHDTVLDLEAKAKENIVDSGCSKHMTGLGHNLFSVGQFYDDDLKFSFRSKTCYVRNLEGDDLLTGARESNLYTISILDMAASLPFCLMSKATSTKSWPMRVETINRKKYILVIIDDYSRFTWVYFLHTKDETPEIIKNFIAQVQLNYNAKVHKIQTDNGTEFKNITLKAHYEKLGIMQQFSVARTPQQNGVIERRNLTLVEAARTMLIFSRLPEFHWAEAISIACFTQNRSIIHTRYNKTPYELLHGIKTKCGVLYVFGSLIEAMNTSSKEDLDNLFGPMYEEYFEKRSSEVSINFAAQQVHNNEDSPSPSSIIVEEQEAHLIVSPSEEHTSPISLNNADEFN